MLAVSTYLINAIFQIGMLPTRIKDAGIAIRHPWEDAFLYSRVQKWVARVGYRRSLKRRKSQQLDNTHPNDAFHAGKLYQGEAQTGPGVPKRRKKFKMRAGRR